MSHFTIILFSFSHIFLLMQLASFATAQPDYLGGYCSGGLNYTANSTYRRNLNSLLSSLASDTEITYGFYNLSVGNTPNKVYGIALCRGDVKLQECRKCINDSTINILQVCPNQMESIGFYDYCMLRYTNRSIFGVPENSPTYYLKSMGNVTSSELDQFNQVLQSLLLKLRRKAVAGDSTKKFATGSEISGFYTIYGLMQCTPDISGEDCEDCLVQAVSEIPMASAGKLGGRVIKPSCNLWFQTSLFYEDTSPLVPAPSPPAEQTPTSPVDPPSPPQGKKSNTAQMIVIIVGPTVGVVIILAIFTYIFLRARKPKGIKAARISEIEEEEEEESLQFEFDIIGSATNDFSEARKLGEGGFGSVYKGIFPNKKEIAVKRLCRGSGQGEVEFKNEVLLVAKLKHRNLVRLLGFCFEGEERLLVYEFLPNSSLNNFIFDPIKRANVNWPTRYKIIGGIARGLVYLHEDSRLRIIHRDLKASNILLDEEMNPKISDFGMARLFAVDQTRDNTTRIVGTFGYMAPEYVRQGHFSVKSDVFSFGVLILEIVCGQKNTDFRIGQQEENLLSYAWTKWNKGKALDLMDPTLIDASRSEVRRCIQIGLLCVQKSEVHRPAMAQVITMLSSNSITLSVPSKPAFFIHSQPSWALSSSRVLVESGNEHLPQSQNEVSMTELDPR